MYRSVFLVIWFTLFVAAPPSTSGDERSADARTAGQKAVDYFPKAATPTESILPGDTLAMATVPSATRFRTRWGQSSFGTMAADPAFGPFFADVRSRVNALSGSLGFDVATLWANIDGELSVGLTKTAEGSLSLIAVANFDENEQSAEELLASLTRQMTASGSVPISVEAGGRTLTSWSNPDNAGHSLAYYNDGGHLVFTDGMQSLMATAARTDQQTAAANTLANSEAYRTVASQTQPAHGAAAVRWFVNPTAVVDAAISDGLRNNPNLAILRKGIEASGLNQFRGFGGLFDLPSGGLDSVSSTYGYVKGEPTGLLRAFTMPATRQVPPRWVKDDVSLYSQMNWTPKQMVAVVRQTVDGIRGVGTFDRDIAAQTIGGSGVTVGEVLDQFDGSLHFAAEVPESAESLTRQSTVIAVGLADPSVAQSLVEALTDGRTYETTSGGARIYTIDLAVDVPAGSPLAKLDAPQVAVAIAEGQLMLSTDANYLKATLNGIGSGRPLSESPEYREIAANYPERTSVINYQRQDARFSGLYDELRTGGMPVPGSLGLAATVLGMDFRKLPPFSAMSRYLQNTGGYIVPAENGFRIVNFSLEPRER